MAVFCLPLLFEAGSCKAQPVPAGRNVRQSRAGHLWHRWSLWSGKSISGGSGLTALGSKLELDLNSSQDFFSGSHSPKQLFKATKMP